MRFPFFINYGCGERLAMSLSLRARDHRAAVSSSPWKWRTTLPLSVSAAISRDHA